VGSRVAPLTDGESLEIEGEGKGRGKTTRASHEEDAAASRAIG